MFWRFIFLVQEPWAGEPVCGACTPHTLGRTSAVVTIFSFVGHLWVLTILSLRPSYLSYCGSFFISLVWKTFSASLQVVLIDSCSINSCNLGVPMGGGKLRVFLLCHLGHSFVSVSWVYTDWCVRHWNWQFLIQLNTYLPYDPAILFLGIFTKEKWKHMLTRDLHTKDHGSFIHNNQTLEVTQMSINRWIEK